MLGFGWLMALTCYDALGVEVRQAIAERQAEHCVVRVRDVWVVPSASPEPSCKVSTAERPPQVAMALIVHT